jgi:SAM-dependent methyltransferase
VSKRRAEHRRFRALRRLKVARCLVCRSPSVSETMSGNGFQWRRCAACGLFYKADPPAEEAVREFMRSHTVELYLDEADVRYRLEHIVRPKLDFMFRFLPRKKGRWLDIASGLGQVPAEVRRRGWSASGTELNEAFVRYAREALDVDLAPLDLESFVRRQNREPWDAVSALGYFEMLADPLRHFRLINRLLKPGGRFFIGGFNNESLSFELAKHRPDSSLRLLQPVTYCFFSWKAWTTALRATGFRPRAVWWHGLDLYEWLTRMVELDEDFLRSSAFALLLEQFNGLQRVLDRNRRGDCLLIVAEKTAAAREGGRPA